MTTLLIIISSAIWLITGIIISHTIGQYYRTMWRSPWDIVRYWKIYRKTGEQYMKWIVIIHLLETALIIILIILTAMED